MYLFIAIIIIIIIIIILSSEVCNRHYLVQLMHFFEVNIRICQPEKCDVHRGEVVSLVTESMCT